MCAISVQNWRLSHRVSPNRPASTGPSALSASSVRCPSRPTTNTRPSVPRTTGSPSAIDPYRSAPRGRSSERPVVAPAASSSSISGGSDRRTHRPPFGPGAMRPAGASAKPPSPPSSRTSTRPWATATTAPPSTTTPPPASSVRMYQPTSRPSSIRWVCPRSTS